MDEEQNIRPRQIKRDPDNPGGSSPQTASNDGRPVEAAHNSEGVYDDNGITDSKPATLDRDEIKDREEKATHKPDDAVNYTGDEKSSGFSLSKFRGKFTRKKLAFGLIIGLLGFGGVIGAGMIATPLAITHAAMQAVKPLANEENDSEIRITRLMAFARSGEFGETRVGWLGSYSARNSVAKFKNIGFEVTQKTPAGRASKITIDLDKFSPGENTKQAADRLARQNNIPRDWIKYDPVNERLPGGQLTIEQPGGRVLPNRVSTDLHRSAANIAYGDAKLGKVTVAMKMRSVIKWNGSYSKLHPIKRLQTATYEKTVAWDNARKTRKTERTEKAKARIADLKSKYGQNLRPIAGAALAQGALCIAKDSAHQASLASYENVQVPAKNQALETISVNSQMQSGDDYTSQQLGAIHNSRQDEAGVGFYAGQAMSALANNGKGVGEDLSPEIKAGFKSDNWGASIESVINNYAGGEWVCSNTGQIVGAGLGILAVAAAAPSGGLTLVAYTGFTAASAAATIVAVNAVSDLIREMIDGEQLTQNVAGAYGGNLTAVGARSLANASFASHGGVAVPNSNSMITYEEVSEQNQAAFAEKSFFARTFDVRNPDSVAGKMFQKTDAAAPSGVQNIARATVSLPGSVAKNITGVFNAKALAEGTPNYDWGFPMFGFDRSDFNNPIVEDPYENAENAIQLIKNNDDLKERAKTCFGVEFVQDDRGKWYTKPVDNPEGDPELAVVFSTAKYHDANCAEKNDDWLRIRMFIFDSTALEAVACYEMPPEEQSRLEICDDYNSSKPKESIETDVAAEGDADLSMLATDTDHIPCYEGTNDLGVVQSKFTLKTIVPSERAPKIRLCQIPTIPGEGNNTEGKEIQGGAVVMSPLSKAYFNLGKDALAAGVRLASASSFRLEASCGGGGDGNNGCASPGKSAHQSGAAIDFLNMGGFTPTGDPGSCSGRMTWNSPEWEWLRDNAENYGIYQFSQESWHWDPFYPIGNRCAKSGPGNGDIQAVSSNGAAAGEIGAGFKIKQLSPYLSSPGGTIKPRAIVLHWWGYNGDGIESLATGLRGNNSCGSGGCSVQMGITKEGEIYQMTRNLTDLTYHARGANSTSIGIEIEGTPADFGRAGIQKYPKKFEAVVATVKYLMEKYNIPVEGSVVCNSPTGIHPHKAFEVCSNQGKYDIDDYYFNEVIKRVRQ